MTDPLVSIILPVFNGARYLEEALESVLAQTYPNWELIIVDDASTDRTPDIISSYRVRDSRILSIRNPANLKLPGTLNAGFAVARGELLTWTSDDNAYRPEAIREMADFLGARPDVDFVYTDRTYIDAAGAVMRKDPARDPRLLPFENPVGPCFLYRRRVYEKIGNYDEGLFLVEDWDYWLRVSCHFSLMRLPRDLYLYRQHEGSLTRQRAFAVGQAREKSIEQSLPGLPSLDRKVRALAYIDLARWARQWGRCADVRRLFFKAVRESPGVLLRRLRRRWAEGIVAESDPKLAEIHRDILSGSVLCPPGFFHLVTFVFLGDRWSYRLQHLSKHFSSMGILPMFSK